ncbi:MAG: response regulator [Nitrospiraceae bacterium]|nr:response regulator [Nitrospiraceae bacterium]
MIVDDHPVFRCGLRALVEKEEDFEVAGEANSGEEALDLLARTCVDVLILDISMPGLPSPQLVEQVLDQHPTVKIVVLSMHDDEHYVREFLGLGAKGYVLKRSTGTDLIQALRAVCRGGTYIDPELTDAILPAYTGRPSTKKSSKQLELLSERELEVCRLLALGYSHTKIGNRLSISPRTVQSHRTHIFDKLGLEDRADLVRFAMRNNLLL